jgi:hypothetical protein
MILTTHPIYCQGIKLVGAILPLLLGTDMGVEGQIYFFSLLNVHQAMDNIQYNLWCNFTTEQNFYITNFNFNQVLKKLSVFLFILSQFITDPGVCRCGTLSLNITDAKENETSDSPREIHTRMVFGGTEVMASALDVATGHTVHVEMDFLTVSSDTEV